MTVAATEVMTAAWDRGLAKGLAQKSSPFDEAVEKKWMEQWLFFANSTRFASAMMGAITASCPRTMVPEEESPGTDRMAGRSDKKEKK